MSEYGMNLRMIFLGLEMEAGLALLEARGCRLNPGRSLGYIDRAVFRARDAAYEELQRTHDILP